MNSHSQEKPVLLQRHDRESLFSVSSRGNHFGPTARTKAADGSAIHSGGGWALLETGNGQNLTGMHFITRCQETIVRHHSAHCRPIVSGFPKRAVTRLVPTSRTFCPPGLSPRSSAIRHLQTPQTCPVPGQRKDVLTAAGVWRNGHCVCPGECHISLNPAP
jgi:hypothetical protein